MWREKMNALNGWKTYVCAALIGIVAAAHALGYVTDELKVQLDSFLYPAVFAALRYALGTTPVVVKE